MHSAWIRLQVRVALIWRALLIDLSNFHLIQYRSVSGFLVSGWLGWLIFMAILLHKAPEGFTMASVMLASGRSRSAAFYSAVTLAVATLAGVLVIQMVPSWLPYGLPLSAGVALYVGASDLVPEVNREPGIRMALVFFAGVAGFLLLRLLLPAL